ncbi:hypothetical protein Lesp02_11900 [Lentzea sp. NBRC 105346]|uniref:PucR family transcriptional regulator n=1 Tax=Lentzea sp. NBRC 105346 TaxID=3032205 RepID=UPI0024A36EAE|nr:helix-turn-helix domain-containing protein [Lentzea sp. NBRC 105346]GLZ29000.1 hypothetical protein Lesp02_11900 [Lentzea sp. NBRC 105346]
MTITEAVSLSPPSDALARALLTGEGPDDLPTAYAVVACHSADPAVVATLAAHEDLLCVLAGPGGYLLVPCASDRMAGEAVRDLHVRLTGHTWMGVAWGTRKDLATVRATAADLLTLALASRRDPGVYELRHLLAGFAVLRRPDTSARLARLIEPVVDRPQLLEALRAFLAEDGNRAGAARRLRIHRSTLDYRLRAIERLTGARPTSPHGVLTLDAALTAHAVRSIRPSLPVL